YPHIKRAIIESDRDFDTRTLKVTSDLKSGKYEIVGHAFLWNAFFNIIHNSIMYDIRAEVDFEIKTNFTEAGDMIRIEFIDKGPGIPDELKTLVFKRPGIPQEKLGRGLGLTVVDRYISDIGGKIWIENTDPNDSSKGCKVIVVIPQWVEDFEIPPIKFYKSEHCVFCGPVLESLTSILNEMGINPMVIDMIDIDSPDSDVTVEEMPALPTIRMAGGELNGFISEDDLRSAVMQLLMSIGT
ncbi:MAG: sensor histidine kinase, partial [Candidatus Thorarchaeota archaeon]